MAEALNVDHGHEATNHPPTTPESLTTHTPGPECAASSGVHPCPMPRPAGSRGTSAATTSRVMLCRDNRMPGVTPPPKKIFLDENRFFFGSAAVGCAGGKQGIGSQDRSHPVLSRVRLRRCAGGRRRFRSPLLFACATERDVDLVGAALSPSRRSTPSESSNHNQICGLVNQEPFSSSNRPRSTLAHGQYKAANHRPWSVLHLLTPKPGLTASNVLHAFLTTYTHAHSTMPPAPSTSHRSTSASKSATAGKSLTPKRKHRKMLKDGTSEVWPEDVETLFVEGIFYLPLHHAQRR